MAFLNNLRSVPLPPVKNMLNVALQTARQTIPAKQKQNGYEEPAGDSFGGPPGGPSGMRSPPQVPPRPQNVHFADTDAAGDTGGTTEMNPLNPFTNPKAYYQEEGTEQPGTNQYQETGFNQGDFENGYQAGGYPPRFALAQE
uniref:Uncharacterized protein n=1 Tax=Anopheles maculatus TaxID=74869 RepID=A0A182SUB2_9DIPT